MDVCHIQHEHMQHVQHATCCSKQQRQDQRGLRAAATNIPSTASTSSAPAAQTICPRVYGINRVQQWEGVGGQEEAAAMNLICPLAKDSCLLLLALAVAAAAFNFQGKILKYLRRKIIYLEFCSSCSILSCSSSTLPRFGIYEHDQTRSSHLYK